MVFFRLFKIRKLVKFLTSLDFESINKYKKDEIIEDLEIQKILNFSKDLEYLVNYIEDIDTHLNLEDETLKFNNNYQFNEAVFKISNFKNKLILMNQKLEKELVDVKRHHSEENWVKSQFANIFSKLQGVNSINEFGNILLTHVANAINAQVGLFYVKAPESEGEELYRVITFFGIPATVVKDELTTGEGIVGQVILEKQIKIIDALDLGLDYVEYGFGKVKLKQILIIPIIYQNKVYSVLEFATVNKFSEYHIEYLNQITEGIALSIKNILNNMLTEKLIIEIKESNKSLASQKQALDSSAIVAETDLRGKITYVNQKFIEISKYSHDELIGQDHRILNSGYHDKSFFVDLWRTISRGEVWHGEVKNKNKFGEYYWVDTTIYPIKNALDKIIKYIAIRFDVTDKKRMLEELQDATMKANIAAKIKTEFLANMSHEIRTPMNAIIAMTDVLTETKLTADQDKYVKLINNAGLILLDVINNILDLSKIEAGQLKFEKIEFNLYELLDSIIAVMSNSAYKKNIQLIVDIDTNIPEMVIGDPSRLRQVLINLLANAIKFTNIGEINLKVKFDMYDKKNLFFSVRDTGIGIAFENYSKIFSVFSQANTSTSREFGGTGLGLSISKKIVEGFGGKINFISELGKGSNFYFTFPHNLLVEKIVTSKEEVLQLHNVLFLENNSSIKLIYENLFLANKLNFHFVAKPNDIIEYQQQQFFEAVFVDHKFEEDKLIVFLDKLNKLATNQKIHVFLLIEKDNHEISDFGFQNLFIEYISKPFYQQKILNLLRQKKTEEMTNSITSSGLSKLQNQFIKPIKILIVDDVLDNIEIIKIYLKSYPFVLDYALNGHEALNKFKQNKYEIILMDIQMPFMDGNETITKIRQIEKESKLPRTTIIMLSAHATTDEMENSKNAGCDGYLTKPIKKKIFIETIESLYIKLAG